MSPVGDDRGHFRDCPTKFGKVVAMSEHVARVAELTDRIETARVERLQAMQAARTAGATWRAIAAAAGMTENGVRKALGFKRT